MHVLAAEYHNQMNIIGPLKVDGSILTENSWSYLSSPGEKARPSKSIGFTVVRTLAKPPAYSSAVILNHLNGGRPWVRSLHPL